MARLNPIPAMVVSLVILVVIYMVFFRRANISDIYVINLDSSVDRLQKFTEQAQAHSLPFKRWPAIDGRELSKIELRKMGASAWSLNQFNKKRQGELGCYFSHTSIWKKVSTQFPSNTGVLIFEDDVVLDPNFQQKLDSILTKVPRDWDGLFLGYGNGKFFDESNADIKKLKKFEGCYAYILRKSSLPKILPYVYLAAEPVDTVLVDLAERGVLNLYATTEKIAFPGDQKSTIVP